MPIADTDQVDVREKRGKGDGQKKSRGKKKRNRTGKMASQLFFRLVCIVPLAVTRFERNVFPGLFPDLTHL